MNRMTLKKKLCCALTLHVAPVEFLRLGEPTPKSTGGPTTYRKLFSSFFRHLIIALNRTLQKGGVFVDYIMQKKMKTSSIWKDIRGFGGTN